MPDPLFVSLDYWRRHTQLLKQGLLQRVDELAVSDYPEATPNKIINFLQTFLRELTDVIDKATEERLRVLNALIRELGCFLEWLDNAHTEQTPRGLVQLLKDLLNRMTPNSQVVARPQAQYNYSIFNLGQILKKLVEDYIPHSKQIIFEDYLTNPINLISFPRIERDNVLSHATFGHEVGHPIADKYIEQESINTNHVNAQARIQKQIKELVDQNLSGKNVPDAQKLTIATGLFNDILQVRKRALEELISDAVGIIIFGPSAFFAFYELFWGSNWDAKPVPPEWYPPSRMRIRLMLDLMKDLGFLDNLLNLTDDQKIKPYVSTLLSVIEEAKQQTASTNDQDTINADPPLKIAYDWMKDSLDEAIAFAKENTSDVAFKTSSIFPQLPELIQRLELGVPPNEVGDPNNPQTVDYRASLLASWMFKIRGISKDTGKALSGIEIDKLHKKTLSAIEYVILQEDYAQKIKGII